MPLYNAVLRFLHLRVATAAEDKFARIAEIIVLRSRIDEIGKTLEFALFFRYRRVSLSFMQVYSPFARASVFIWHCFNRRHCAHDVLFKILHRGMLMIINGDKEIASFVKRDESREKIDFKLILKYQYKN